MSPTPRRGARGCRRRDKAQILARARAGEPRETPRGSAPAFHPSRRWSTTITWVRYGLIPQPAQAPNGQIPPLVRGNHDVDREAHPRPEAGAGAMAYCKPVTHVSHSLSSPLSDLASDPRVDRQIAALTTQHSVISGRLGSAPTRGRGVYRSLRVAQRGSVAIHGASCAFC